MGLLRKAEHARHLLLKKLTRQKKQYLKTITPTRRGFIHHEIEKQRKKLQPKSKQLELLKPRLKTAAAKTEKPSRRSSPAELKKKIRGMPAISLPVPSTIGKVPTAAPTSLIPSVVPLKETSQYMITGIAGFDSLLERGIPKGAAVLIAGGAGSGKTIFGLQIAMYHAARGKKCLYMSFEESEEKLMNHLKGFSWNPQHAIQKGNLLIKRFNPFEVTRNVDALLMQAQGELLIPLQPVTFPQRFKPEIVIVDSLTAVSSAFSGNGESYRMYLEQLFRFFENINATSFLITETEQVPKIFSTSGVEEFLADMVIVLYNIRHGNIRERAIEVLKLRGAGHQQRIVAMSITPKGIEVFPEQEIFGEIEWK